MSRLVNSGCMRGATRHQHMALPCFTTGNAGDMLFVGFVSCTTCGAARVELWAAPHHEPGRLCYACHDRLCNRASSARTVWRRYLMLPLGVLMPVGSNVSLRFASFTLWSCAGARSGACHMPATQEW